MFSCYIQIIHHTYLFIIFTMLKLGWVDVRIHFIYNNTYNHKKSGSNLSIHWEQQINGS